jgi:hypothetical protein
MWLAAQCLPAQSAETWTVLVYMAGDNNLWQNAVQDVNDMESVALPPGLKLLVQTDLPQSSPYPGGQRRLISQDNSPQITSELISTLGAINSGSPQTLNDFARWGFERYPSDRKALFIWGHGNSWFKGDTQKWLCPDDGAEDLISVSAGELKSALAGLPYLDILLFDACSMQSLEVLSEVKDFAWRVIGSAELVPAQGFPYQDFLDWFDGRANAEQICYGIVEAYVDSYSPGGSQNPDGLTFNVTCSAVRGNAMDTFLESFKAFCIKYRDRAEELLALRDGCWEMNDGYNDVDILQYLQRVSANTSDPMLVQDTESLVNDWYVTRVLEMQWNVPSPVGGAAIWFPWHRQYFDGWWSYYSNLDFAETYWLSLLNRAYGEDETMPYTPQALDLAQSLGSVNLKLRLPDDPDELTLQVDVITSDATQTHLFPMDLNPGIVTLRIPVAASGVIVSRCIDRAGNVSGPATVEYGYSQPALKLEAHPNPVMTNASAIIRWFVPDGIAGTGKLLMYNIRGQMALHYDLGQVASGEGGFLLNTWQGFSGLSPGVYLLRLNVGASECVAKITIQ